MQKGQGWASCFRGSVLLGLLLISLCVAGPASADVSEQGGDLYSIEKREIMGSHELVISLGVLPMDAFAKGLVLQGSYTYHFSQMIGWEIVGGMYSFNIDTGLRQELRELHEASASEEAVPTWVINSNLVFKPLFGKFALTNDKVATGEVFFVLGYALGGYAGAAYPSGLDPGLGIRMFLGRYFSLRLDIRDYIMFRGSEKVDNNLYLSLGLSLTFGFGDEEAEE